MIKKFNNFEMNENDNHVDMSHHWIPVDGYENIPQGL